MKKVAEVDDYVKQIHEDDHQEEWKGLKQGTALAETA